MQIAVIGVGYVGLVTAAGLAESGNLVIGYDIDVEKLKKLQRGEPPIYEPGLDRLLERGLREGRLRFAEDLEEAILPAELIFLALPTPAQAEGEADLSFIFSAAEAIVQILARISDGLPVPKIVVTKSTVPVGTARRLQSYFEDRLPGRLKVASNPEFLREGYAVEDFLKPDRVIIGTPDPSVGDILRRLYLPYTRQGNPIYIMDWESAELTKYAANAFLAMRISFMNEIARLCEHVGADIDKVRLGMGADTRIGRRYLFAGIGYGGSCFPKDTRALLATARQHGLTLSLVEATIAINEEQRRFFWEKIWTYFEGQLQGKTFAIWGVAFKPDTDDIREAPALYIIQWLLIHGASIRAFDPIALPSLQRAHPDWPLYYARDPYDAAAEAHALLILTEWAEFRQPEWMRLLKKMCLPVIFDGRNLYELDQMRSLTVDYFSIGRPSVCTYSERLASKAT
ncbi:MAG: UDP-glucose/GDP-mannose dehydrogenase family protein [Bacteroidia bacterium]|nr:UDP-glucose/GDP-mannose dehydrogenase family protein [Bacteroidia bacterium]MDW8015748.1 UDP-glucose/GDP-mannose dehydrogenase family protein [Bacteroidia bacterium]